MSDINRDPEIMTVKELRKLTGKATEHYTDEQLEEQIKGLDFLANLFIKKMKGGSNEKPISGSSN
jgi:hypothetical protein